MDILTSNPAIYHYECDNCGTRIRFDRKLSDQLMVDRFKVFIKENQFSMLSMELCRENCKF